MRLWTRFLHAAGLVLIALTTALATTEIALHSLRYRTPLLRALLYSRDEPIPFAHVDDVRTLLDLSPYHPQPFQGSAGFKLNSFGFRTHEYDRAKPEGTYRIVALGDSFTFDSGFVPLDRMWHTLVGENIRARIKRPVELLNLGVPGVGPRFALRLFEIEARRLSADLVLFGLFVGNDLGDDVPPPDHGWSLQRSCLSCRLFRHAVVLAGAPGSVLARERGPGGYAVPGYTYNPDVMVGFISEESFLKSERGQAYTFAKAARPWFNGRLDDVVQTVIALDRAVREARGRLVVVIIPDQVQVDEAIRQAVLADASLSSYDFDWPQPVLTTRLAAAGVSVIDLLPAFRAAPPVPRLYGRRNTHWSAAGNALAAEVITARLPDPP